MIRLQIQLDNEQAQELRRSAEEEGVSQEDVARRLNTKKSVISRIENHAEDIRYSTLKNYARALNRRLMIQIV